MNKSKIAILLNWNTKGTTFWLKSELEVVGYNVDQYDLKTFDIRDISKSIRKPLLFLKYTKLVIQILKKREYSIIITPNFHIGAVTSIISRIFNIKVNIIGFNLIVDKKNFLIGKIREWILKFAFKNKRFYFTLNGMELIEKYQKVLKMDLPTSNIFELYDCYSYEMINKENFDGNYVFCGGITGRDWDSLFQAAKLLPEIMFKCIIQKESLRNNYLKMCNNIEVSTDFSRENYRKHLINCTLITIPLLSEAPSGLLTIFEGALNGKAIITTDTLVMRKFITNHETGILINKYDFENLAIQIQNLMINSTLRNELAVNLKKFLESSYSPKACAHQLDKIITSLLEY